MERGSAIDVHMRANGHRRVYPIAFAIALAELAASKRVGPSTTRIAS